MPEYVGSTPPLAINGALLAVALLPLVDAVGLLLFALARLAHGARTGQVKVSRLWAAGPTVAATLVLGGLWARTLVTGHGVISAGLPIVRTGSLDWAIALSLDGLAGPCAIAGGVLSACALAILARAPLTTLRKAAALSAANVAAAGLFVTLLADNGALVVLAFAMTSLAASFAESLVRTNGMDGGLRPGFFVGNAALACALSIAFWAFGGTWATQELVADMAPRIVAVRTADDDAKLPQPAKPSIVGQPSQQAAQTSSGAMGALTMTTSPGALVYLDSSRTPWETAPFVRAPVSAGPHSMSVDLGQGADEHDLHVVVVPAATEARLMLVGPSFRFRDLSDQLTLDRTSQAGRALRDRIAGSNLFGVRALFVAWLLMVAGAVARAGIGNFPLAQQPSHETPSPAGWYGPCAGVLAAGYLLVRISPWALAGGANGARWGVVAFGLLAAFAAAHVAHAATQPRAAWQAVALAQGGFVIAAIGSGAFVAAVVFAVGVVAAAAGECALPSREDRRYTDHTKAKTLTANGGATAPEATRAARAHVLACLSLGFTPGLVNFWGVTALFLSLPVGTLVGITACVLVLVSAAALASAVAKIHARSLLVDRASRHASSVQAPRLAFTLLAVATSVGVLGAEAAFAPMGKHAPLTAWLARDLGHSLEGESRPSVALALALLASLFAFLARGIFVASSRRAAAMASDGPPSRIALGFAHLDAWSSHAVTQAARALWNVVNLLAGTPRNASAPTAPAAPPEVDA